MELFDCYGSWHRRAIEREISMKDFVTISRSSPLRMVKRFSMAFGLRSKLEKREDKCDTEQTLQRRTEALLHCISKLPLTVAFTAAIFTVF